MSGIVVGDMLPFIPDWLCTRRTFDAHQVVARRVTGVSAQIPRKTMRAAGLDGNLALSGFALRKPAFERQ